MIRGEKQDERIYDSGHIHEVLSRIGATFPKYFADFNDGQLRFRLAGSVLEFEREQPAYLKYFDEDGMAEYEDDPNAFKKHTRNHCPIIHRCLMSQDEVMNDYKASFNSVAGRNLLDTVRTIAQFGKDYVNSFDGRDHEQIDDFSFLGLTSLGDEHHTCAGVIGYGIQSNFLHMLYPHAFAYRAQDAVWSLFFLSDKQSFDFEGGSEFVIYYPKYGTGEQNFVYPPELFGFYALKIYLMLKEACRQVGVTFEDQHRYIYLDAFLRHIASMHRNDINALKQSSDYVENHWH